MVCGLRFPTDLSKGNKNWCVRAFELNIQYILNLELYPDLQYSPPYCIAHGKFGLSYFEEQNGTPVMVCQIA